MILASGSIMLRSPIHATFVRVNLCSYGRKTMATTEAAARPAAAGASSRS